MKTVYRYWPLALFALVGCTAMRDGMGNFLFGPSLPAGAPPDALSGGGAFNSGFVGFLSSLPGYGLWGGLLVPRLRRWAMRMVGRVDQVVGSLNPIEGKVIDVAAAARAVKGVATDTTKLFQPQ